MNLSHLERQFLYFTECNLATLERLHEITRSSKSERQRQANISNGMLSDCRGFMGNSAVKWDDLKRMNLPRTLARLSEPQNEQA